MFSGHVCFNRWRASLNGHAYFWESDFGTVVIIRLGDALVSNNSRYGVYETICRPMHLLFNTESGLQTVYSGASRERRVETGEKYTLWNMRIQNGFLLTVLYPPSGCFGRYFINGMFQIIIYKSFICHNGSRLRDSLCKNNCIGPTSKLKSLLNWKNGHFYCNINNISGEKQVFWVILNIFLVKVI